jgi:hypothetical protein
MEQELAPEHGHSCRKENDGSSACGLVGIRKQENVKAEHGYCEPTQLIDRKNDKHQENSANANVSRSKLVGSVARNE